MTSKIQLWNVFETELKSPQEYSNPLWDASVRVQFTAPSGRRQNIDAFWDGGAAWRVRFSPDEIGLWRWQSVLLDGDKSSNESDAGLHGQQGEFLCRPYSGENLLYQHGPLQVSSDRRHLVHADGTPFFWLADTAWNGVLRAREQDWQKYLQARRNQQFSVIQFVSTQWRGGNEVLGGQKAFHSDNSGDSSRIRVDAKFFQRLDAKVAAINEHGLIVSPVILWALTEEDPGQTLSEEDAIRLARYVVARWGAHQVVWMLGGDGHYREEKAERWHRIGRAVFADRHDRIVTMHPCGMNWVGDEFQGEEWFDFIGYQSGHGDGEDHLRWLTEGPPARWWRDHKPIPIINLEPNYEAHPAYQSRQNFTDYEVRRASYWSLLVAPTAGITFGHNSIWVWSEETGSAENHKSIPTVEPWHAGVDTPGVRSMTMLRRFMESLPWHRLRPAPQLIGGPDESTPPESTIMAAKTPEGDTAVVYLPTGGEVSLRADELAEAIAVHWFNPRTGEQTQAGELTQSTRGFTSPDNQDWLLVVSKLK